MFNFLQGISVVILISCSIDGSAQTYCISGTVQQTFPYCGGAVPTPEILHKSAELKPFANKTFYVRKGKKNKISNKIIAKFTTDSVGHFSFKLPQGTYSILVDEQSRKIAASNYITQSQTVDDKCLQTWWQKPYYLLVVKKNNTDLNFVFNHRCNIVSDIPCITYTGPKRP